MVDLDGEDPELLDKGDIWSFAKEDEWFFEQGEKMTLDAELHAMLHPPKPLWQRIIMNISLVGSIALGGYLMYDSIDIFAQTSRLEQSIRQETDRRAALQDELADIRERAGVVAQDGTLISRLPASQDDVSMLSDYCSRSRTIYQSQSSYQRIYQNTVQLDLVTQGHHGINNDAGGSGVLLTQNGYVVTAHHVVNNMISGVARFRDGSEHQIVHPAIISSPDYDLAIIKIDLDGPARAIAYNRDFDAALIGETVFVFGYFDGIPFNQMGRVTELHQEANYTGLIVSDTTSMTTYIRGGFSGGPVVRMDDGALQGITTYASFNRFDGIGGPSGFVPLIYVKELLERYLDGQSSETPE